MNTEQTFLAVYLGSQMNEKMKAWHGMPEAERRAREREGIDAWKAWAERHQGAIVTIGGPLGKTKRVDGTGTSEVTNQLTGFSVVRAASHDEAAKLFENHPHFSRFPGEAVEIMPVLPIPNM